MAGVRDGKRPGLRLACLDLRREIRPQRREPVNVGVVVRVRDDNGAALGEEAAQGDRKAA